MIKSSMCGVCCLQVVALRVRSVSVRVQEICDVGRQPRPLMYSRRGEQSRAC